MKPVTLILGVLLIFAPFHKDFSSRFSDDAKIPSVSIGVALLAKGIFDD